MKIGIIGVGNMGSALGKLFAQHGHEIMFSFSRDTRKIEQAVRSSGSNARSGTPEQAARFGDVVLLAVGWGSVNAALSAAGSLDGNVVISCVNPLTPDFKALVLGRQLPERKRSPSWFRARMSLRRF